jgi:hypothetical protein
LHRGDALLGTAAPGQDVLVERGRFGHLVGAGQPFGHGPDQFDIIAAVELIKVGGGKAGGFDISELIPGDYLARSFASASVDKKNASTQSPAETLQKSAPFLLGFVVIGMASYFGVLPR